MMYESLRGRVRKHDANLSRAKADEFVNGALSAIETASERGADADGLIRARLPDSLVRLGKRLGVPFCKD